MSAPSERSQGGEDVADADPNADSIALANGSYLFVRSDAERNYFDADGRLTAIENRAGHRHDFTYDARGALPLVGTSKRSVNPSQPTTTWTGSRRRSPTRPGAASRRPPSSPTTPPATCAA